MSDDQKIMIIPVTITGSDPHNPQALGASPVPSSACSPLGPAPVSSLRRAGKRVVHQISCLIASDPAYPGV
jgi:hypothetical protein